MFCCGTYWHAASFGCGPRPLLAMRPISVWLVRGIMYSVSAEVLMHWHRGSTCSAGESIQLRGSGTFPWAPTLTHSVDTAVEQNQVLIDYGLHPQRGGSAVNLGLQQGLNGKWFIQVYFVEWFKSERLIYADYSRTVAVRGIWYVELENGKFQCVFIYTVYII